MAKKNIKKPVVKVVKAVKSNRGVKEGVKRGPYKKKNKVNEVIATNNGSDIDNISVNNNVVNNNTGIDNNILPNEVSDNSIQTQETQTNVESEQNNKPFIEPEINDENIFNSFVNENKTNDEFKEEEFKEVPIEQTQIKPQNQQQFKVMINGYMLLAFIDFIMPLAFIKIGGYLYPEIKKIKAREIKLTQDQKEGLKEIADHLAQFVFQKMNPLTAFMIMLGISYGGNIQEALANKKESEVKE